MEVNMPGVPVSQAAYIERQLREEAAIAIERQQIVENAISALVSLAQREHQALRFGRAYWPQAASQEVQERLETATGEIQAKAGRSLQYWLTAEDRSAKEAPETD